MTLPKKVLIGPHEFKVEFDAQKILEHGDKEGSCFGYSDFDVLHIVVDSRIPETRKREVLLHEIIHCCLWAFSIDVPVIERTEFQKKDDHRIDEEEKFIQQFTGPLMLLFRMNPTVFAWILEKEKAHGN